MLFRSGAFSGFDTIQDCFGDLTGHIHALETGLSSDPPMNWRLSALDGYHLVSNSDAHSPAKLGREANLLDTGLSYPELARALETGEGLAGTVEFFPEEGKYHFDGHRGCAQCLSPLQAEEAGGKCPVCGKRLTTGVLHRVEQLADRPEDYRPARAKPFERLSPLPEVIAASDGGSAAGKKTMAKYEEMLARLGPEFTILRQVPLEDIGRVAGPCVAEGVRRLRAGQVVRRPGYDGVYGTIELLSAAEREDLRGQVSLFGVQAPQSKRAAGAARRKGSARALPKETQVPETLNGPQRAACQAEGAAVAVLAGPGAGKTRTLVERIAWLVEEGDAKPGTITAVTFTNRAAAELRERLAARLGRRKANLMTTGTFHSICLALLENTLADRRLADPYEQRELAAAVLAELGDRRSPGTLLQAVSLRKRGGGPAEEDPACSRYQERLAGSGALDFDDLLLEVLALWEAGQRDKRFTHLLVDEFQDIDPLQYRLISAWRNPEGTLFVIGDPDQSIYSFRGADPACFRRLEEDIPALCTVRLTSNYRSTPEILACALPVVEANGGPARSLRAEGPPGAPVRLVSAQTQWEQAAWIAREIARMVGGVGMLEAHALEAGRGSRAFGDCAVLYRTRRQAAVLEECLSRAGIPCLVTGREDFLTAPEVRIALEELRAGPADADPAAWLERWAAARAPSSALERLRNMAVFFPTAGAFLENLTIGQEGDLLRRAGQGYAAGAVTLSTLHGSKGLEWPVVFLCGVERGLLPLEREGASPRPEEERRLLYVGMTRAREELVLLHTGEPSPFLQAVPEGLLQRERALPARPRPQGVQLSLF